MRYCSRKHSAYSRAGVTKRTMIVTYCLLFFCVKSPLQASDLDNDIRRWRCGNIGTESALWPEIVFFSYEPEIDSTGLRTVPDGAVRDRSAPAVRFGISKFLVTAEEFCSFLNDCGNKGSFLEEPGHIDWRTIHRVGGTFVPQKGADRCPAYPVTWVGASEYCRWLSSKLGCEFRLPTEHEWEYAASGPEKRIWPWGNTAPELAPTPSNLDDSTVEALVTPFYELRGLRWMYIPYDDDRPWVRAPVGSFPLNATPEGLYDMVGYYAGQWCANAFENDVSPCDAGSAGIGEVPLLRSVRGMYEVPARPIDVLRIPLVSLLMPGDAKGPQSRDGKTFSRMGLDARKDGAMFRVAVDALK